RAVQMVARPLPVQVAVTQQPPDPRQACLTQRRHHRPQRRQRPAGQSLAVLTRIAGQQLQEPLALRGALPAWQGGKGAAGDPAPAGSSAPPAPPPRTGPARRTPCPPRAAATARARPPTAPTTDPPPSAAPPRAPARMPSDGAAPPAPA